MGLYRDYGCFANSYPSYCHEAISVYVILIARAMIHAVNYGIIVEKIKLKAVVSLLIGFIMMFSRCAPR